MEIAELNVRIKFLVEDAFKELAIHGKVKELKRVSAGHAYFKLESFGQELPCVFFFSKITEKEFDFKEDDEINAYGKITMHKNKLQLFVREVNMTRKDPF